MEGRGHTFMAQLVSSASKHRTTKINVALRSVKMSTSLSGIVTHFECPLLEVASVSMSYYTFIHFYVQ